MGEAKDIFVGNTYEHWKEIGDKNGWTEMSTKPSRSQIDEALQEMGESALLMDGFDEAFIGFSQRINEPILAVYSYDKLINVCMERDGMEYEEAMEYVDFNVVGAWVGEQTPIIVMPLVEYSL
jgi:hypothetical protein